MYAYIIRRILATIPVMAVVAVFVFLLLYLTPGDPAAVIAGDYARPEDIERIRQQLGLNRPLYVQFFTWAGNVLTGDLGISIFSNLPVAKLIGQRLEPTLMLALCTTIFAVLVAVPIGVLAAWKAHTWIDRSVMVFAVLGFSVPVFVIGYLLMWAFSINLGWFPVQGYKPISQGIGPFLSSIALPTLALGLVYIALIARMTRASVMEVLTEDYIRTARAKGLPEWQVVTRHALRGGLIPVVAFLGPAFAGLLAGSFVVETIFQIPGLGRFYVQAAFNRDYTMILGTTVFLSTLIVLFNLLSDILAAWLNPRLRAQYGES